MTITDKAGDYFIMGFEDKIVIERKELWDLTNCIGKDRDRFMAQMKRLSFISKIDENCVILIDASLSMGEWIERKRKIDIVVDAIPCLKTPKTAYALITFSDDAEIKKQFTSKFGAIISASQNIIPSDNTEMAKGLESAISLFVLTSENRKRRIILLSDGNPTCPDKNVIVQAQVCYGLNITIDTIAAGYDSNLLKTLSELTGGKYQNAQNFNIKKAFKEIKYENRYIKYNNSD